MNPLLERSIDPLNPLVERILHDATLSANEKINKLRPYKREIENWVDTAKSEIEHLDSWRDLLKSYIAWTERQDLKLELNDCSRLHKFREATKAADTFFVADKVNEDLREYFKDFDWSEIHTFVIQHDWAAAFEGAEEFDLGEVRLPYEYNCFEFRISGQSVITFAHQQEGGIWFIPCIGKDKYWFATSSHPWDEPQPTSWYKIIKGQVRAICIAIDAQVAVNKVVRSDKDLNAKRERNGKPRLFDYHIVSLNRNYRSERLPFAGVERARPRLHFRRGHWRHYEAFKTWIRWTLAGNPDLGFIDKHYKL